MKEEIAVERDYDKEIQWANEISDELGLKHVCLSLTWRRKPKLTDVFHTGPTTFVSEYDNFWGEGSEYRKTIDNPTWADVFKAADESIEVTGDHHHIFLESISYNRKTKSYHFWFGS